MCRIDRRSHPLTTSLKVFAAIARGLLLIQCLCLGHGFLFLKMPSDAKIT